MNVTFSDDIRFSVKFPLPGKAIEITEIPETSNIFLGVGLR